MKQLLVTTSYLYNSAHNFGIICSIIATRLQIVLIANQDYTVAQWWCKNCPSSSCPNNAATRCHAIMRFFSVAVQKPPLENFLSEGHGIGQLVNLVLSRKNLQPGCESKVAVTQELGPFGYHLRGTFCWIIVFQQQYLGTQVLLYAQRNDSGKWSNHLSSLPFRLSQVQQPLNTGFQVLLDAKTKNLRMCGHYLSNLILCQPQVQKPLNTGFQVLLYAVPKDWGMWRHHLSGLTFRQPQVQEPLHSGLQVLLDAKTKEFEDVLPLP